MFAKRSDLDKLTGRNTLITFLSDFEPAKRRKRILRLPLTLLYPLVLRF